MKSSSMRIWLPMFLMCWGLLGACASLPDVAAMGDKLEPAAATPSVKGKNGDLGAARTKALLAKRWPMGSLDLKQQAVLEEAAPAFP